MKQFKILSQIVAILLLFSCDKKTQNHPPADIRLSNKIEVIDFHSTRRCMTCNAIESSTIYTLNNYFPEEMKSGTISFRTINVDEKENYNNLPIDQKKVIEIFNLHNSKKRDCHPYLWAILMLLDFNRKNLTN